MDNYVRSMLKALGMNLHLLVMKHNVIGLNLLEESLKYMFYVDHYVIRSWSNLNKKWYIYLEIIILSCYANVNEGGFCVL